MMSAPFPNRPDSRHPKSTIMKTRFLTLNFTTAAALVASMSLPLTAQEKPAPPVKASPENAQMEKIAALMELAKTDKKKAIQQTLDGLEKAPTEGLWGMGLA